MWTKRNLTLDDLPGCRALSDAANWNQNDDDWRFILTHGTGCGLADDDGLFATAAVVPYGDQFAWICMVLVAVENRGRGHATSLMHWATELAASKGLAAGLDATPAGREVYRKMGFEDVYSLARWESSGEGLSPGERPNGHSIRPLSASDWPDLIAFDRSNFGSDRSALLKAMYARMPQAAFVARLNGTIAGFVLARPGCRATQFGPVVANDEATAIDLLLAGMSAVSGPVFCDVPDHHLRLGAVLADHGMQKQRMFTRMLMNRQEPFDVPARIFALTGPEFG